MNEIKPGWKTSELWVVLATVTGGLLGAVLTPSQSDTATHWLGIVGFVAATVSASAYAISRGITKRG